ncbi:MAG: ubiquitin-conjugating enzyme E2 [Candidatus Hodarchaeota archaeon]
MPRKSHRVFLKINRSFPYPGGIDFSWFSEIYHPNIHPVDQSSFSKDPGTGYICLNVLKKWSRLSDLETTVKALELLVENPNPDDPLNYPICLEATEFFKNNSMEDLKKQYSLEGLPSEEEEVEEEDDDIIILDD